MPTLHIIYDPSDTIRGYMPPNIRVERKIAVATKSLPHEMTPDEVRRSVLVAANDLLESMERLA